MAFTNKEREKDILKLETENFDLLVIGGGITGAGIALDATARGLKVALVDICRISLRVHPADLQSSFMEALGI